MPKKVANLDKVFPTKNLTLQRVRALYAEWNWSLSGSYIRYFLGDSPYIYEHRLVVEVLYGRNTERYHVHHKDGNGTNNDPANLEVLDPSSHAKIHLLAGRNDPPKKVIRQCAFCGDRVERTEQKARMHKISFCNNECAKQYRSEFGLNGRHYTKPPEREELATLLQTHTHEEIAAMFGCLKYTVARWISRYGLGRRRRK